jgi:hypothetical protein
METLTDVVSGILNHFPGPEEFLAVNQNVVRTSRSPETSLWSRFKIFVTNRRDSALEIWRDYNGRATVECRIDELEKTNWRLTTSACEVSLRPSQPSWRGTLWVQSLGEFQRAVDPALKTYKQRATLRFEVFTCGAILDRSV